MKHDPSIKISQKLIEKNDDQIKEFLKNSY